MSTQRREDRWQRTSCTASAGASKAPGDRFSSPRWRAPGQAIPSPLARYGCADATVGTAPPGFSARTATISLQSGFRIVQLDRLEQLLFVQFVQLVRLVQLVLLVRLVLRHGSPPFGAGSGEATSTPATHGIPLPRISFPSAPAPLHPTLPRVPAGRRRWAERYDGKRNLHFQYAA
jgi:hypothetical protein